MSRNGLIALLLAFAAAGAAGTSKSATPPPLPGQSLYQLTATLQDQSGRKQTWSALRGRPRIATMFYSSCPYMCPLIIESGKAIDHALTADERSRLGFVLVTLDVTHDTPAVLAATASKRHIDTSRWLLLRPEPKDLRPIAAVLGVRFRALANGEFNHNSVLVLLDGEGRELARTEHIGTKPDPEFLAAVHAAVRNPTKRDSGP